MTVAGFAAAVYAIGKKYNGSITSWGRSEAHSKSVGGFAGDPHTWWLGADMIYDTGPNNHDVDMIAETLGLRVIHENGHDHFQPRDFPAGPVLKYPIV